MATVTLRKLIKLGQKQLAITIPTAWIRYYKLKAGDSVEVIAESNLTVKRIKEEG
ncbi:AbrB/MazE/SpoVT family DNA-binding domain-containing protein [Chloroflexota bacterium]